MNRRGKFIVIEGSDGSGKRTQLDIIKNILEKDGYNVATYDFPQYSEDSSYFVREYLNGRYGNADTLGAKTPSLFYALDRFQASRGIHTDIEAGNLVLCNRYVGSNLAHQGQKIDDYKERKAYYEWLLDLEFDILGIPKPDLSVVLHEPAEIAQGMASIKHTDQTRDIHETNLNHLKKAVVAYQELCQEFPDRFVLVDCIQNETLLGVPQVTEAILAKIKPLI